MDTGRILKKITDYVIPRFNTDIRSFSEKMKLAERSMLDKKEPKPKRKFDSPQQPKVVNQQPKFYPTVNDTETESSGDEDDESQLI